MTAYGDNRGSDDPNEPVFEDGAYHIELNAGGWMVYDAYWQKYTLGPFADVSVAIDACIILSSASAIDPETVDAAYRRLDRWQG